MDRFLIENEGPDTATVEQGIKHAARLCAETRASSITFLMDEKKNFLDSTLWKVLGKDLSKHLFNDEIVNAGEFKMGFAAASTFRASQASGVVLGVHLGRKGIDVLENISGARAVIFIPWTKADGVAWLSTWKAETLGPSTWAVEEMKISDTAEAELKRLAKSINHATGLAHPADQALAERILATLHKKGDMPTPPDVRKWALAKGWPVRHADALEKIAEKCAKAQPAK